MISTDLKVIADHLEGLEESIIHRLIDRAQFAANTAAYEPGKSSFDGAGESSLFLLRLRHQEEMDALFGRYDVPEECPYHNDLPQPRRHINYPDTPLNTRGAAAVNCTTSIVADYLVYLPSMAKPGDDGQYGSSVEHDVLAIQAIGRRIHYGALYVAESKYRERPQAYETARAHARAGDHRGLEELITRKEVEVRILSRVADKVRYIQASLNPGVRRRVEPEVVLTFYRDTIIPLTKKGEIDYLIAREPGQNV